MKFDLHCHSNASDGALAPVDLLLRARAQGVSHLAITDHDTVRAYAGLQCPADLVLIPGIELSAQWRKRGIHIVGLNLDLECAALQAGIARQQEIRRLRARRIANRLVRLGLPDFFEAAGAASAERNVGRPHFAQALVAAGHARSIAEAFRKYLGDGKPANVRQLWPDIGDIVGWIRAAGGTAVLAHPGHYKLTRTRLGELLEDFVAAGGSAIEVISGQQDRARTRRLADVADDFNLLASTGSDFHRPGVAWAELGCCPPLPDRCRPVWDAW